MVPLDLKEMVLCPLHRQSSHDRQLSSSIQSPFCGEGCREDDWMVATYNFGINELFEPIIVSFQLWV